MQRQHKVLNKRLFQKGIDRYILVLFILLIIITTGFIGTYINWQRIKLNKLSHKKDYINLVFAADDLWIASLSSSIDTIKILIIPKDIYLATSRNLGSFRAEAILGISQINNLGGKLLGETVEKNFAIKVDGWIGLKKKDILLPKEKNEIIQVKKKIFSLSNLPNVIKILINKKDNLETNLSLFDLIFLWYKIHKISSSELQVIKLNDQNLIINEQLADDSIVKTIDIGLIDNFVRREFAESQIRQEDYKIAIYNASGIPNLANLVARFVENSGASVISVLNADEVAGSTQILCSEKIADSFTVSKIKTILNDTVEIDTLADFNDPRVDIKLILGKNIEFLKQLL